MNISTIISKAYAVTTVPGCTVSTTTGITLLTVPEQSQGYFIAPTTEVVISDEDAIVTPIP